MNKGLVSLLIPILLLWGSLSFGSSQGGISLEVATGLPQMNVSLTGSEAYYQGFSTQAQLLLPLLDTKSFSMDLDVGYRTTNYENTANTGGLSEWASMQGIASGLRFNVKYFFFGTDVIFLNSKHLVGGTSSEVNSYKLTPVQAMAGVHIPVGDVLTLALSYSTYLIKGRATVNSQDLAVNEQLITLRLQIDLGIGFFNFIEPEDSFKLNESDTFY